jgi:hypothetical protein
MLIHISVYCLCSNETEWNAGKLWHTCTMLTDLEAVFRSLKSELSFRPVYQHKEERVDGHLATRPKNCCAFLDLVVLLLAFILVGEVGVVYHYPSQVFEY